MRTRGSMPITARIVSILNGRRNVERLVSGLSDVAQERRRQYGRSGWEMMESKKLKRRECEILSIVECAHLPFCRVWYRRSHIDSSFHILDYWLKHHCGKTVDTSVTQCSAFRAHLENAENVLYQVALAVTFRSDIIGRRQRKRVQCIEDRISRRSPEDCVRSCKTVPDLYSYSKREQLLLQHLRMLILESCRRY